MVAFAHIRRSHGEPTTGGDVGSSSLYPRSDLWKSLSSNPATPAQVRDAEVEGLRERVDELVDGLERERAALNDVSGKRDSLKVECVGLVEKVRRYLEGSFERLKLQNEKLVGRKRKGRERSRRQ
ncbi:hypothetical protein NL676_024590 [Syzygium grande]|nr:hypothetical protein NL676_024590 [Syzygium grande]